MNRMLVVVFDSESKAEVGSRGLHHLDTEGAITLYALSVIAKDAKGNIKVLKRAGEVSVGTGVGLAVGSLIGLLGGPVGVAAGAVAGTLIGAVRDFWVAGVGVDFIEDTGKVLKPGKVALVAEVEEEWVTPVDARMTSAGGVVYRRARSAVTDEQVDRDIAAFKAEIVELEAEVKHASVEAKSSLALKTTAAKAGLEAAVERGRHSVEGLKLEAETKLDTLNAQIVKAKDDAKAALETRMKHVRAAYDIRSSKLSKAWGLTKEALTA